MKHYQSCAELSPRFMGRFKIIIIILVLPINLSCLSHFYGMQTTLEETMRKIFRKKILSHSLFLAFYSTLTINTIEKILPNCDSPLCPPEYVWTGGHTLTSKSKWIYRIFLGMGLCSSRICRSFAIVMSIFIDFSPICMHLASKMPLLSTALISGCRSRLG